jgi:beta-galactosidase
MRRMVVRDRQFPSVLMWSLGNEAGWGSTFLAMRDATKAADPEERVIQYADMNRAADLDSQTYPTPAWLLDHVAGKAVRKGERGEETRAEQHGSYPSGRAFLMNEYAHAMGNSVGNFRQYWDVIDANPMLVGGFIWDWVDQALWKPLPGGGKGYVYGGDFGDKPNNLNSCCDGLVDPDRVPHPHYREVAKVHQAVRFRSASPANGTVEIANGQLITNVSDYRLEYEIAHEGVVVDRAERAAPDVPAGETRTVRLFEKPFDVPAEGETFLTVRLRLARDTVWAPAGHVVAWEQLSLTDARGLKALPQLTAAGGALRVSEDDQVIAVHGTEFRVSFGRDTCLPGFFGTSGRDLAMRMRFNFWRALTDNDRGWKVADKMGAWRTAVAEAVVDSCHTEESAGTVTIRGAVRFPTTGARAELTHIVHGSGAIDTAVKLELPSSAPEPPRLGFTIDVPSGLDRVEWFGRGPHENYVDRMESAAVGLYRSTISDWVMPYVRPQENANRGGVRRVSFLAADGRGLTIQAPPAVPLSVGAWPYALADLEAAKHDDELPHAPRPCDFACVPHFTANLDHLQMGVGGDNSWGAEVHREFRIATGRTYEWTFRMSPQ